MLLVCKLLGFFAIFVCLVVFIWFFGGFQVLRLPWNFFPKLLTVFCHQTQCRHPQKVSWNQYNVTQFIVGECDSMDAAHISGEEFGFC